MSRKSETPIIDFIRRAIAGGAPVETALFSAEPLEREATRNARVSAHDMEVLNKRREFDRNRKRKNKRNSTGTPKTALPSSSESRNIDSEKEEAKNHSGGIPPAKRPSSKGMELPADWQPSEGHFRESAAAGLSRADVLRVAERMRLWAIANRHRAQGRKADLDGWNATFTGTWLAGEIEERRKAGGRSTAAKTLGQMAFGGLIDGR